MPKGGVRAGMTTGALFVSTGGLGFLTHKGLSADTGAGTPAAALGLLPPLPRPGKTGL